MSHADRSVLFLTRRLSSPEQGRDWSFLVRGLAAHGFRARFLCVERDPEACQRLDVEECPGLARPWQRGWSIRRLDRPSRRPLIHVLDSALSDAGLALAEHWSTPYVQTVDEFPAEGAVLRLSGRWCRRLLATSEVLADELIHAMGVPAPMVRVIRPGLVAQADDDEEYDRLDGRTVPVVGAAGPMVAASGFFTFLSAARRVLDTGADVEFVVAGQGEDEVDLRRRADRLRMTDRVTFAGRPAEGMSPWDAMDVYCHTSTVSTTAYPLIQAMARGVPSIVTDVRGPRSLITPGVTGLIVPPEDSQALARAILAMLANPEGAAELGKRGRDETLDRHDPEIEVERLLAVYDQALSSGRPPELARMILPMVDA